MSEEVLDGPGQLAYPSPPRPASASRSWLAVARRRSLWFTFLFLGGLVISLLVAYFWPATYRAHATILIEQQEIPPELVRSTVTAYADERLQVITQRVMTTPTLLDLMAEYDLYPAQQRREPREKLLERIREDIGLEVISAEVTDPRSGRAVQATIAFELSFRSHSSSTAYNVANRLLTLYQQENRKVRTESVDNTAEFLAEEAEKLRVKIEAAEARLATFKASNVTDLPELFSVNVELLNRTERELSDLNRQLRSVIERERYLEAALTQNMGQANLGTTALGQLDALRAELRTATATYGATHPDVLRLSRQVASLERALNEEGAGGDTTVAALEAELADLRSRYSDQHPDVLALERRLADARAGATGEGPDQSGRAGGGGSNSLVLNPTLASLRAQYDAARAERGGLEEQRDRVVQQLAELQSRLLQTPEVESEYRTLTRDYENDLFKYREIRNKLLEARLAQSLESGQRAERFTVLEFPEPPQRPEAPNRVTLMFVGVVLSLGLAVLVMTLVESTDRTVRGPEEMAAALGFSPLAMIPVIRSPDQRARRLRMGAYAAVGAAAGGLLLLVIIHFAIIPLDTALLILGRRLGLT